MCDATILSDLRACGYLLSTQRYKYFALECIHCQEKFGRWITFLEHLKAQHMEEEIQWLDEAELKSTNVEAVATQEPVNEVFEKLTIEVGTGSMPLKCEADEGLFAAQQQLETEERLNKTVEVENTGFIDIESTCIDLDNSSDKLCGNEMDGSQSEFELDFSRLNDTTTLFVTLYKAHTCLWNSSDEHYLETSQCNEAYKQLLDDLNNHNISLSLRTLKSFIAQIRKFHDNINTRLSQGLEISDVQAQYLEKLRFLQSPTISELSETESLDIYAAMFSDDDELQIVSDEEDAISIASCPIIEDTEDTQDTSEQDKSIHKKRNILNFSHENSYTCDFIQCYRDHACLWDPQDEAYNDNEERNAALDDIKEFFWTNYKTRFTDKSLAAAITRLRVFYRRCYYAKREICGIRKYYFELCSFLADITLHDKSLAKSSATTKIQFDDLNPLVLGFIALFEKFPVLWDYNHVDYSSFNARKNAYKEMAACLYQDYGVVLNKDELRDATQRLKHYYYSTEDKKFQHKPLTKSDLIYLERCKFLPAHKPKIQCHLCVRTVRNETNLQVHLLKEHNIGQLPHKCTYCELRFSNRAIMKEHEVRAHTKQFEWFCQYCNKGFANRRDMEMHELVHTGERNCICEHCGKCFRLKHQLMEHVKVVHERVRRFKCNMCPKDYLRKRHLDDHIRGHLNIRDKICGTCGKSFTNFHALFRHKQLHSDVKRYECKLCGERFHQFVGLNGHMKRRHKIMKNADIEKDTGAVIEMQIDD